MYSVVHVHRKREVSLSFHGIPARQQAQFAPYSVGRDSRVAGSNVEVATTATIW